MSDRIVRLTQEQRDWLAEMYDHPDDSWNVPGEIVSAFDSAGDQSFDAYRYCTTHKRRMYGQNEVCAEGLINCCAVYAMLVLPVVGDDA